MGGGLLYCFGCFVWMESVIFVSLCPVSQYSNITDIPFHVLNFFQDIHTRGINLLDSALQLSEAKECNPEEISNLAKHFEEELTEFSSRLTNKREALEMAKNFFHYTEQVFYFFFGFRGYIFFVFLMNLVLNWSVFNAEYNLWVKKVLIEHTAIHNIASRGMISSLW